jgi:EAL domain-containing protein (putative c-di-GMP-specific phosphodiesterase class I)
MASNRLLVIDDEPASSATIGRIARGCGYDTIITTDIDDFRSRVASWEPTVIVLDLTMPEMDGRQLIAWLAKQGCKARILIVSGREPIQLQEAEAAGNSLGLRMAGSLEKPLRVEKLRRVFREIYHAAGVLSAQDVSHALMHREIRLEYQPQMDLQTGATIGFEALARWDHPRRGAILPDTFIPMLEEHDIVDEFTAQIFEIAFADLREWNGGSDFRVAINVSAANFRTMSIDEVVRAHCNGSGIDCTRIAVELTETAAMTETARIGACLGRLHGFGVQLSIDDFGTGYSSLVKLHQLPFTELKIDRSFVTNCGRDAQSAILVRAMIDLGHSLKMKVIAEGVESLEVRELLRTWGCDAAQGFFVGRPMRPHEARQWQARHLQFYGA